MRLLLVILILPLLSTAQEELPYQPETNARASYDAALKMALAEHKRLWIQIGEPGCPACKRLFWFIEAHAETSDPLHKHFIPVHVAISRENIPLFRAWESPQIKHGVPVILIVDTTGQVLTVSPSSAFAASVGEFSEAKIAEFLLKWAPKPLQRAD